MWNLEGANRRSKMPIDVRRMVLLGATLIAGLAAIAGAGAGSAQDAAPMVEPVSPGGPVSFRRLDEQQYKRSIAQVFGADIEVAGRFEPGLREAGLLAIGDSKVVVTPAGFEQNAARARQIANDVFNEKRRARFLVCAPGATLDRACAQNFFDKYGRLLFRRPLNASERTAVLRLAQGVAAKKGSMVDGMVAGLYSLLASPAFAFRIESTEPDPSRPGQVRLDSYSLATRISFLLWNAPPDGELLDAAASGALHTQAGLAQQVDRLIASPRLEDGVRAFFSDMLGFDEFIGLTKDSTIFPIFNPRLRDEAMEQTLKTIVNQLLTKQGDYRELFTTRETFLTRSLAALYAVPMDGRKLNGWVPYTYPESAPHAGLLTMPAMLMLDPSHEGRSSPTIRGKTVRERLLCQPVPLPPANVNFQIVQDVNDPLHKTARERLMLHQENPVCAGCHKITDPIGLSLENYNPVGQYRTTENGVKIDATGDFDGKSYSNALELSRLLHDSPAVPACVVQRTYEYGVGREIAPGEDGWVEYLGNRFAADGYRYPALLRRIAMSAAFQAVALPKPAQAPKLAALSK